MLQQPALVPLLDLCNSDIPPPPEPLLNFKDAQFYAADSSATVVRLNRSSGEVELLLKQSIADGRSVLVNYGLRGNAENLLHYGFTVPWIGSRSCLTVAPLVLVAPTLPNLVVHVTRCTNTDHGEGVGRALAALRWHEMHMQGLSELPAWQCSELRQGHSAASFESTGWHGCQHAPSVKAELAAWSMLAAIARDAGQRHSRTLNSSRAPGPSGTTHAIAVPAHTHVVQILADEILVFDALANVATSVVSDCGHTRPETLDECVRGVRELHELSQWQELLLGEL
eukprot:gnl/TRDRNA2_/TRDRNA2_82144_c1_seq1.p1 gnl/TRDRNA2_/TRDRNA2_82144_c1~~gnl/TRDRNA2_/TRDRNA2_82144_c1_seq1.p1  ORF type:complete len:283 (-),score=30.96 gnl/TRDRNA2_/TRDRNA2_82144_c1_seq1:3-851(-)